MVLPCRLYRAGLPSRRSLCLSSRKINPAGRRWQSIVASSFKENSKIFKISEEVRDAIATNKPVVALETTIYTHGFPFPESVELATHLESVVRKNGAVPATIGVLEGVARVGMTEAELSILASAGGKPETMKVSRRDLSYITGVVRISSINSATRLTVPRG